MGRMQIAASCKSIPDIELLNRTIPIKFPTAKYNGINNILINIETLIEDFKLDLILSNSFLAYITLNEGIRTMLILPMMDIGTKSIGKVIPITTPKQEMASLEE
jgi:hypothetical protein